MQYKNGTASAAIKATGGTLMGVVVNSHTSGTIRFNDGASGTTSAGVKATGTITASGVFANNETITIADTNTTVVYTMKTTLTGAPYEVLIGASAAASLDNIKSAINGTAGAGTTYGTGTPVNPVVSATTNGDTTQVVEAYRVGTYGNAITTTETGTNAAWGAATLASGAEASLLMTNTYTLPAGSQVVNFGEGIDFHTALYLTVGGTIDYTVIYK